MKLTHLLTGMAQKVFGFVDLEARQSVQLVVDTLT